MKRLVCVLAPMLVLILAAGGDLNGYDRFGGPGDGPAINPGLDDHPWGGDQAPIAPTAVTTRNDGRDFAGGSAILDHLVYRIVTLLLPTVIDCNSTSVCVEDRSSATANTGVRSNNRNSLEYQTRVER